MSEINDALVAAVKAIGGSKVVGCRLWPDLAPDHAQRKLLDALNSDRPHHLTPEQTVYVMRLARERGHHGVMACLCEELAYAPPQPVSRDDEAEQLRRAVLEMGQTLQQALQRLEELDRRPAVRAVT